MGLILSSIDKQIIKVISQHTPYMQSTVEDIYRSVNSWDNTMRILQQAMEMHIDPRDYCGAYLRVKDSLKTMYAVSPSCDCCGSDTVVLNYCPTRYNRIGDTEEECFRVCNTCIPKVNALYVLQRKIRKLEKFIHDAIREMKGITVKW